MNIPLSVLVQALEALEAVNDYDTKTLLPTELWSKVMRARSLLGAHVYQLTESVPVEVAA